VIFTEVVRTYIKGLTLEVSLDYRGEGISKNLYSHSFNVHSLEDLHIALSKFEEVQQEIRNLSLEDTE